jgi:hypothetical protein
MARRIESPKGFVFGDHVFLDPMVNGPLSRFKKPKKQIYGAPPPTYLERIVRESSPSSRAATELLKGKFCGHGEPTMTVFDIVLDRAEYLQIAVLRDPDDPNLVLSYPLVAARRLLEPRRWVVLFRREWEGAQQTLEGVEVTPVTPEEAAALEENAHEGRVSIGFEYPCDATSRDSVGWIAIAVLLKDEKKPKCIVSAELA